MDFKLCGGTLPVGNAARCELFARILDAIFDRYAREESESPRLLIVVEEAHRFTAKRVACEAQAAGQRADLAMDRIAREGRKYGLCLVVVSQPHRDFAYDAAGIRQNTTTKIFLHNSDREVDYAADFLDEGKQILHLGRAQAVVFNPTWGAVTIAVCPPRSKVWEYSDADTRKLLGGPDPAVTALSETARQALDFVRQTQSSTGQGPHLSQLAEHLQLTSKRTLQRLVSELETSGLVRSRRLQQRGRPRILELIASSADESPDKSRTNPGNNGHA